MVPSPERRQYHPAEENVPLSVAVREAVQAHESTSLDTDAFDLYNHINPDAIDMLFKDTDGADVIVQVTLSNVLVSIWSNSAINIRVTDPIN